MVVRTLTPRSQNFENLRQSLRQELLLLKHLLLVLILNAVICTTAVLVLHGLETLGARVKKTPSSAVLVLRSLETFAPLSKLAGI